MNALGKYIDNDGEWDVFRNSLFANYELRQGAQRKYVEYDVIDQYRRLGYYAGMQNAWRVPKPTKRALSQRWRDRMLRLKEKERERRMRFLSRAGWNIGLVWGGLLVTVITIYLLKWTTVLVLG